MTTTTKTKKRKKPFPWRTLLPWIIVAGVILAILLGAAIYNAIVNRDDRVVYRFDYLSESGEYRDTDRNITYKPAPFCFEAVLNGSEDYPYANSDFQSLYRLGYRDEEGKVHLKLASAWLCTSKSVGGQVYYNPAEVKVPTIEEFNWDVIHFTNLDSSQFSTYTLNAEDSDALMKEFTSPDAENLFATLYHSDKLEAKLTLKVSSKTYKWLYLNLNVLADADGNYYLCPQGAVLSENPRLIAVDKAHFEDYFKTLEDIIGTGTTTP